MSGVKLNLPKRLVAGLDELADHKQTLRGAVFLQFVIIMGLIAAIIKIPDNITVYIPPNISNGAVMNLGDIPNSYVLSSTSHLWIETQSWLDNGEMDAFKNMSDYRHYFSDRFKNQLENSYIDMKNKGELDRERRVTSVPGSMMNVDNRVFVEVPNRAWTVFLDVIVQDYYLGEKVQHVTVRYALQVEKVDTNVDRNPLGLMIVGFDSAPVVIKDMNQ